MSQTLDVTNTTAKWQPYSQYKASGVEWLGEIPEHWEVKRLKQITTLVSRGNSPEYVSESSIQVINQACIYWDGLHLQNVKYQQEVDISDWKGLLRKNDLLLNSTATGTLGRAAIFAQTGTFIADGHVTIIRLRAELMDVRFVFYLLYSPIYQRYIYSALISGSTNQIELSKESLRATPIYVPPLPEQLAIAAFLDREAASINALIAKKQQLITLLRERRIALISHAVTKGLDPTMPMKNSGVAWVGEIPSHWEVKRLKFVTPKGLVNGLFKKRDDFGSGTKLVNVADIYTNNFLINLDSLDRVKAEPHEIATYKVSPGDIFFVRSSLKIEGVGVSACVTEVTESTVFECHLVRLRLSSEQAVPKYIINYLNSSLSRQRLISLSQTTTMTTIGQDELASLEIALPPLQEQQAIVDYLDKETTRIDALIARIEDGIKKLQEYSTALISAAVTGKIDVRNITTKAEEKM